MHDRDNTSLNTSAEKEKMQINFQAGSYGIFDGQCPFEDSPYEKTS